MTLETILQAARNSIPSTSPIAREIESRIDDIQWAAEYAEPGYSCEKGIVMSDWNKITGWKQGEGYTQEYLPGHNIMCRLEKILSNAGYECEWSDEWSTCCDCGKLVRTSGDSYGWQPHYIIQNECELVCLDCAEKSPETTVEEFVNNERKCVPEGLIKLLEPMGFVKLNSDSYENGFHPGQNDNPAKIAKEVQALGHEEFVFNHDEQSQFYTRFSVWVRSPNSQ